MRSVTINSEQNELFKLLRSCLQSRGIQKEGLFLVSGSKAVRDVAKNHLEEIRFFVQADGQTREPELEASLHLGSQVRHLILAPSLFRELDIFGTHHPLLVLQRPEVQVFDPKRVPSGLEVFCSLGEPHNVGALIRSCAAFSIKKMILLKESASPFHPKAMRAASGSTLHLVYERAGSIRDLSGLEDLIALDLAGEPISQFRWPKNARLLIGEEGQGVPGSVAPKRVHISISKNVESLNAVAATSIGLYAYRVQHSL